MALQQGQVTITGYLGSEPLRYGRDDSHPACTFRLGCTRRYMDRNGAWQQLPTTWITVKAFRTLALNVVNSFHKGDAVIVVGVLGTEQWTTPEDGVMHSRMVIEASNAGPDLNYCVSSVRKLMPKAPQRPQEETGAGQAVQEEAAAPVEVLASRPPEGTATDRQETAPEPAGDEFGGGDAL